MPATLRELTTTNPELLARHCEAIRFWAQCATQQVLTWHAKATG